MDGVDSDLLHAKGVPILAMFSNQQLPNWEINLSKCENHLLFMLVCLIPPLDRRTVRLTAGETTINSMALHHMATHVVGVRGTEYMKGRAIASSSLRPSRLISSPTVVYHGQHIYALVRKSQQMLQVCLPPLQP